MEVKKGKSNISEDYIEKSKNEYVRTEQDKVFLMYDLDVDGMLEQLQKIPNAILLVSNPCLELWFLLHYQEQLSRLSSEECIKKLQKVSKEYKKGILSEEEKVALAKNNCYRQSPSRRNRGQIRYLSSVSL